MIAKISDFSIIFAFVKSYILYELLRTGTYNIRIFTREKHGQKNETVESKAVGAL